MVLLALADRPGGAHQQQVRSGVDQAAGALGKAHLVAGDETDREVSDGEEIGSRRGYFHEVGLAEAEGVVDEELTVVGAQPVGADRHHRVVGLATCAALVHAYNQHDPRAAGDLGQGLDKRAVEMLRDRTHLVCRRHALKHRRLGKHCELGARGRDLARQVRNAVQGGPDVPAGRELTDRDLHVLPCLPCSGALPRRY